MTVGLPVHRSPHATVAKTRLLHGTHVYHSLSVFQLHAALGVGRHHVAAHLVVNGDPVLRHAVLQQLYFDCRLLARPVQPVGMVGHCHPQHIAAVRVVLGLQGKQGQTQKEK